MDCLVLNRVSDHTPLLLSLSLFISILAVKLFSSLFWYCFKMLLHFATANNASNTSTTVHYLSILVAETISIDVVTRVSLIS